MILFNFDSGPEMEVLWLQFLNKEVDTQVK